MSDNYHQRAQEKYTKLRDQIEGHFDVKNFDDEELRLVARGTQLQLSYVLSRIAELQVDIEDLKEHHTLLS